MYKAAGFLLQIGWPVPLAVYSIYSFATDTLSVFWMAAVCWTCFMYVGEWVVCSRIQDGWVPERRC